MVHRRSEPKVHQFTYRIFLFAIDLDELEQMDRKIGFFSFDRANLYSFRDRDYLPTREILHGRTGSDRHLPTRVKEAGEAPSADHSAPCPTEAITLKQRVIAYAAAHDVYLKDGKVVLVTLPRVFGTLFNPVSFYFCYDRDGKPVAALAEVTNTFREMKPFFLGAPVTTRRPVGDSASDLTDFRLRVPKHFYVSPFSDVDVEFDFRLRAPSDRLAVQIDDYTAGRRTFRSTLTGRRKELTSARLAWYTIKYPLLTLRIITLIHWHAFRLWRKKIPWFRKDARSSDQRDLYRAHSSLTAAKPNVPLRTSASRPSSIKPSPAQKIA